MKFVYTMSILTTFIKAMVTKAICILAIFFAVWVGISYLDVVSDNTQENPSMNEYNFFVVALGEERF